MKAPDCSALNIYENELKENSYYVVRKKCVAKEAKSILRAIPQGEGFTAYTRIYKWYKDVSGMAITTRMQAAMNPTPPKKEEEIANSIEKWMDLVKQLETYGTSYEAIDDRESERTL